MISAAEPRATPPAIVEFKTISMSNLPLAILAKKHAEMQLVDIPRSVLMTVLCYCGPNPTAALKDGQYMKRKRVPIIATRLET